MADILIEKARYKKITVTVISIIIICALTAIIFNLRKNRMLTDRDKISVFCYQTNITGSDGELWAEALTERFSREIEVGVFVLEEAGNEQITISGENGWSQIVTRLAAKQGDIILLNNEAFYNTMLKNGFLAELDFSGERAIADGNSVYGIDITGLRLDGLKSTGLSTDVAFGQPLPIRSIDEKNYSLNGEVLENRVIAVIYKGSSHTEEARAILKELVEEAL